MERFGCSSSSDIETFKALSKNSNTTKSTNVWVNCYHSWANCRGKTGNIENLPPNELDCILQQFFAEIKKQNGDDYEPSCLSNMQAAIERYLKEKGYSYSILNSREFTSSREVLEGKARAIRKMGKGKRPNKACSLSPEEVKCLWDCGEFGCGTPYAVVNTIWWQFTVHFGLRGRQEHHDMKIEDFQIKTDDKGTEYITYAEGITKTRQSGLHQKTRDVQPKMFATGTERCPVAIFKFYRSKRPLEFQNKGPFYLAVINNPATNIWYKKSPMGVNLIDNLMKSMIAKSPLATSCTKKITNHSARRTLIKTLKKKQVPKCDIITITGHTTTAGLDPYDSGDEAQQEAISRAIDNVENNPAPSTSSKSIVNTHTNQYPSNSTSNFVISPNDPRINKPCFNFFTPQQSTQAPAFNFSFNACTVNFNGMPGPSQKHSPPPKKKRYVLYSSDSSQEN